MLRHHTQRTRAIRRLTAATSGLVAVVLVGSVSTFVAPATAAASPEIIPGSVLQLKGAPQDAETPAELPADQGQAAAGELADEVMELLAAPEPVTTSFVVSSFNVLGAGHSKKRGMLPGAARTRTAARLLRENQVSVAGLQEFQMPQVRAFARAAPGYEVYPAGSLGASNSHNSIVWNTASWRLVQADTTKIPYFGGNRLRMPHVLLENRATGEQVWFMNYHNPADAHGPAHRWRTLATTIEANLANRLMATGHPVIMTGDFNERRVFACQVTRIAPLHSADGARTDAGTCHTPQQMSVDWILGSPDVEFSEYIADRSRLVNRTSDHPMIRSRVTITGEN